MSTSDLNDTLRQLVTANHILHYYGAVDGFGHISVRHPEKPDVYIMCGYMAPALVETKDDLIEYYVDGSDPVDPNAKKGYSERFIHGEMYKRYPDVHSVVHSHAEAVLPYVVSEKVPVWDIAPLYSEEYQQDMLVNNPRLGASLAATFSSKPQTAAPEHNVVLMKRHGYTTHGPDMATAVYRTIYTIINAGVQTKATTLQAASHAAGAVDTASVEGLNVRHARDCRKMNENTQDKAWKLWVREVEVNPLYRNGI